MKIREVVVSVVPENFYDGNGVRISIRVTTQTHTLSSTSQFIRQNDFKSLFEMILEEAKQRLLKEIEKNNDS